MQTFQLEPDMLTMAGVFYPTGYVFVMFPSADDAQRIAQEIDKKGLSEKPVLMLDAATVLGKVVRTVGSADIPLPSAGTEAATVRKFAALAGQGHCAVMVHAPKAADTEAVMKIIRSAPFSFAEKYRQLVIEDLV